MPTRRRSEAAEGAQRRRAPKKVDRSTAGGDIPVGFIFDEIYKAVVTAGAKKVAPQEVEQLKAHLDGASKSLKTIARKLEK